jgi:TPR repeat protein
VPGEPPDELFAESARMFNASKAKAVELLRRAASAGHPDAVAVGKILTEFVMQKRRPPLDEQRFLLEQYHAAGGDAQAMLRVGKMLSFGTGCTEDHRKAVASFQAAGECGVAEGWFARGIAFYAGKGGLPQDFQEAAACYRRALDGGWTDAEVNLAICYLDGDGVEKDGAKAFALFQLAARRPNTTAIACKYLAECYEEGVGVERDTEAAARFKRMAAQGLFRDHGVYGQQVFAASTTGTGAPVSAAASLGAPRFCAACGRAEGPECKLTLCSRCKRVRYCGKVSARAARCLGDAARDGCQGSAASVMALAP